MSRIKIDVGGVIFHTTKETLCKSGYFRSLMFGNNICESSQDQPIFVDRDAQAFRHVLGYLRNSNYQYPIELASELDYYTVSYNRDELYCNDYKEMIIKEVRILCNKIDELSIKSAENAYLLPR